jgi:hypothetical protein
MVLASSASANVSLSYQRGPVLHSSAPYLVFWTPSRESIPARSQALMERYFADVAADSGKSSNVFSVLRQYYDRTGFADYRQTFNAARQVIADRQPYPRLDRTTCPDVSSAYPICVSDGQIQSELQRLIAADHLPTAGSNAAAFPSNGVSAVRGLLSANAPIYFVVLPADVNVCYLAGTTCADNKLCGYHLYASDRSGSNVVLYAAIATQPLRNGSVIPNPKGICQGDSTSVVQDPTGDVTADSAINVLSHELSETITDPIITAVHWGWWARTTPTDASGTEVGDNCGLFTSYSLPPGIPNNPNAFLPVLGGSESAGTLYDQLINGHRYYTQSEWSNGDNNCEMRPSPGKIAPRFSLPKGSNTAGSSFTFSPAASTSTNALSSATWNFGDGSRTSFFYGRGTLTPAKHRYRKAGRYTVTLTLVDNRGNLQTTTRRVTVRAR